MLICVFIGVYLRKNIYYADPHGFEHGSALIKNA